MSATLVGRLLARRIYAELQHQRTQTGPKLVVHAFYGDEVATALEHLEGLRLPGAPMPVQFVVDVDRHDPSIPERFRLAEGRSLTWHRNNSRHGLVLFTLTEASDRQGLGQLYRITDRSVLDERLGAGIDPARWLVEEAWAQAAETGLDDPPEALLTELAVVRDGVERAAPIALRVWTRYVAQVCRSLRGLDRAVAVSDVREVLGADLSALDLFPHPSVFADLRTTDRALARNRNCSSGRDPKGKPIRDGFLAQRVEDVDLAPLGLAPADAEDLREAMRRFAATNSPEARRAIDFRAWNLLFDSTTRREGLGARVRKALEGHDEQAAIFDELEIEGALDDGEPEAASLLLDAETPGGDAVVDVLPTHLRRRVERTAVPPSRLEADPLQGLLRHLVGADDLASAGRVRLALDPLQGETSEWSRMVFCTLYARTLCAVAEESALGGSLILELDPAISTIDVPSRTRDQDEDDTDGEAWGAVHFGLWVGDEETPRHRFRWLPDDREGWASLVASLHGYAASAADLVADVETLAGQLAAQLVEDAPPTPSDEQQAGLVGEWLALRSRYFAEWATSGIEAAGLKQYVDQWTELLLRARDELVPANRTLEELDQFLDMDVVRLGQDRAVLLAVHPLRLRWLAGHLAKLGLDLAAALAGTFELNPENDALYFEAVGRVSAHRQPPMLVTASNVILAAGREFGLHEEYVLVGHGRGTEPWIGVVDEGAVKSLADMVSSYVASFPYKLDGLGLLLLVRDGDPRLPDRLVKELVRSHGDALVAELHVVAPRERHQAIAAALAGVVSDGERELQLLPRLRLTIHDWPTDGVLGPLLEQLGGRIDVALVPNLFGAQTALQVKTRPRTSAIAGHFDPWLDPATHSDSVGGGEGENVSRSLLPADPDPVLEAWSTLAVRRYYQSPVAPEQQDNTDYFTLQVTFDRDRSLFQHLHEVAHWVVTLDPFIGRDQIDAMKDPPDVILVRTGVGKNKTHTLVVSSRSGRRFVERGLKHKLADRLGFTTEEEQAALATRLYDLGRNTVPGVTLRALGLGRGIEEILGLTVTRYAVEEHFPVPESGSGFEWWVSLDDHLPWFGGAHRLRADLMRVVGRFEGDQLDLQVEVVESKFRQQEDLGTAEQQLARSINLLEKGLAPHAGSTMSDADFWRREMVSALDETSRLRAAKNDLPALRLFGEGTDQGLYRRLRATLVAGAYTMECRGIACTLAIEASGPARRATTEAGYAVLRMTRDSILEVLDGIAAQRSPVPRATAGPGTGALEVVGPEPVPTAGRAVVPSGASRNGGGTSEVGAAPRKGALPTVARSGLAPGVLEQRYQAVLDAFNEFRIDVGVPEGQRVDEGPGFYLARIVPGAGVSADKLMTRITDLKLRLGLPQELDIRTYADRGAVVFEIPKVIDERYDVDAERLWALAPVDEHSLAVALGEDIGGQAVSVDFSSSDSPHLLVAGTTGSGKSVALETILRGLCRTKSESQLRLHLIDPKGTELVHFEDDPHVAGRIGMDAADAIAVLEAAVEEMRRRYAAFKALRVRDLPAYNALAETGQVLPWWLIVLDEYADLTADLDEKRELEALLRRLAQKARAAGLHVIVATQRPSADIISPVVRANLPAQLALRVRTATDSRVILDEGGAEALAGRGDALLRTARGVVRLQCAVVQPPGA